MKIYKNFTTQNSIHEEGFTFIDIRDENKNDWYKLQKEFQEDTFKILYDSKSRMVVGYNKDASMIAPFEGTSIIEVKEMPEFNRINELFVLESKFKLTKLEKFQKIVSDKVIENLEIKKDFYVSKKQELQRKYLSLKKEKEEFEVLEFSTEETILEMNEVSKELKNVNEILKEIEKL